MSDAAPFTDLPAQPPTPAPATERTETAWRSAPAHLRFWLVAVLGLALDLWSKHWAFKNLGQGGQRVIIPKVLEFQIMLNPGALFGIGHGMTSLFLLASVLALALVLWMFSNSSARRWGAHIALGGILAGAIGNMYDRAFVHLVPLPFAGPQGYEKRYYERELRGDGSAALYQFPRESSGLRPRELNPSQVEKLEPEYGYVRDFIKIPTKIWGERDLWPWVFNVADMLLVGGVSLLVIHLWTDRKPQPARTSPLEPLTPPSDENRPHSEAASPPPTPQSA